MSIKLMNMVLESVATRKLAPSTKSVLLMIANNASDDGIALSLKVEKIGDQTNYDERTIQKAFRLLVDGGFISIQERKGRVSIYTVHTARMLETPGVVPGVVEGASRGAPGAKKSTQPAPPAQSVTPSSASGDEVKPHSENSSDARSQSPTTPGVVPGVPSCGLDIPTPGAGSPAPGIRPPVSVSSPFRNVSSPERAGRFKKSGRAEEPGGLRARSP